MKIDNVEGARAAQGLAAKGGGHHGRPETTQAPAAGEPVDEVLLSDLALETIQEGPAGPGKSGQSTAHRARALIEANPHLADQPFGQIVSRLARGLDPLVDFPPPAPDPVVDPTTDVTEGDGTEPVVTDETGDGTGGIAPEEDDAEIVAESTIVEEAIEELLDPDPDAETTAAATLADVLEEALEEDDSEPEQAPVI